MDRRTVLLGCSSLLAGLAGCLGGSGSEDTPTPTPGGNAPGFGVVAALAAVLAALATLRARRFG